MDKQTLRHVAIIPDGNRRWAQEKGLPSVEGHRYASDSTLPKLYDTVLELNIEYCTFWALSPENFTKRSSFEIKNLMRLLHIFIRQRINELTEKNIKLNMIGDIDQLPENVQRDIKSAVESTKHNTGFTLTFALNYGGRDEIIRAIKKMSNEQFEVSSLNKDTFAQFLDTTDIPDPDLIIRTGGEQRTSGFMLWQAEYAEYAFLDKLFPDFTPEDLKKCVDDFNNRQRRFGK